jgi:hypothetical protein
VSEQDDERAVLGDELQQRGDPQGELIGLQLALEALPATTPPARRNMIERKIAALLDHHHAALYGALAPFVTRASRPDLFEPAMLVKTWRGGFADTIWIQRTQSTHELVDVLRAMRVLPIARFVRRLEIGDGDQPAVLGQIAPMPSLRELVVSDTTHSSPRLKTIRPSDTQSLNAFVSQLEVLEMRYTTHVVPFAAPVMKKLLVYEAHTDPARLFDLTLPVIEDLTAYGFRFDRDFFDRYPTLRRVRINATIEPGWFEHFLLSPAVERLETLAISSIGDAELLLIHRYAHRLERMQRLDLANNYFSPQARQTVYGLMPPCVRYR